MDPFLGQIMMVPYDFAPRGWAFCHGQLLPIMQNTALFSLLGNRFGGDGRTNFALPDLSSRVPVGAGQGRNLRSYQLGEAGGWEDVHLEPKHLGAGTTPAKAPGEGRELLLLSSGGGGHEPVDLRQPYLAINFIIAIQGVFPARH